MRSENLFSEFKGFEPDSMLMFKTKSALEKLQMLAPSDAIVKFVFEKEKGITSVTGKVASVSGVYLANDFSTHPEEGLELVKNNLIEQLNSWKQSRFLHETSTLEDFEQQVS